MAIRLARFNIHLMQDRKKLQGFFIGIPAPASALLLLIPIMLSFEMSEKISIYFFVCYTFLIGIGAASRIPTFSLKNFSIHQEYVWVYMVIFALLTVLLILSPWIFIPVLGLAYILSIPASYLMFKKNYEK